MIYTCTVNPSLDYFINVDKDFKFGLLNRVEDEHFVAGGKGVNVSFVLNNLMINSTALGFLGGFTREYYLSFFKEYRYVLPNFTPIKNNTRINIKLNNGIVETDINAKGPEISDDEFNEFLLRTERIYAGDTFILSGHVQTEMYNRMINLIKDLSNRHVNIILDTNPDLIAKCLKYHPLLIKPNLFELSELRSILINQEVRIKSIEDVVQAATGLVEEGATNVVVSLGADGAMLFNEDGIYRSNPISGQMVSTTGCGDSMVGAFVFNLQRGANALEAFTYACAAGAATAFKEGLATRDEIEDILDKVKINKF